MRTLRNDIGGGRGRNRCDTFVPKRTVFSGRGGAFTLEALFALQERERLIAIHRRDKRRRRLGSEAAFMHRQFEKWNVAGIFTRSGSGDGAPQIGLTAREP